ncbi:MAG: zf-HC2 domain-containing protein [Myxococcota bacterium]|nr:zf-HC2 domain-containing protein [Myxococcota bacterium]
MKQQAAHSHEDKLLDFAYGELPEAEARSVETHLAGCARCAGSLESIRGVRRTMSLLETEPAPDSGMESLLAYAQQTARRIQAGPSAPPSRWRAWVFGLAGAASLVVVGIVGTTVSKEFSPQAVIQQKAQVSTPAPAEEPEPVRAEPASEGLAAGAASNTLAERATRVTPTVPPQRGRVVSDKEGQLADGREAELDVGRLGERAKRDVSRRGSLDGLNDDQDMTQGGRNLGGLGAGMTTGGASSAPEPLRAPPAVTKEERRQLENLSNYRDSRTAMSAPPPPPPARPSPDSSPPKDAEQKVAASRISMGKGAAAPAGAAMDEDRYESSAYRKKAEAQEAEESGADDQAQAAPAEPMAQAPMESAPVAAEAPMPRKSAPTPPQAPPTTRSAASAEKPSPKKKLSSLSATDYERLANRSRAAGQPKEEIRYLWEAVGRTTAGGQQIGLLSRLCELEVSAEMYQPQSCHRLITDYPRHNAGLLAKKRLQAQEQQMQRK